MSVEKSNLLGKLNDEQKTAVLHQTGPMLIVAGAGTGKTTVLINRLVYLVTELQINPENILLLTFTEKAASEMVERADQVMPYGYVNLWINTFHSFCEQILRDQGLEIGLNSDFRLITQTEQWILIKKNLALFNLNYYSPIGNPDKFVSELIKHFSRLKDENISPSEYLQIASVAKLKSEEPLSGPDKKSPKKSTSPADKLDRDKLLELAQAYETYNKLLLDRKLLDFGDLILYTLKLFKDRPNILAEYQAKFKYLMVDEFQDTNWSQYELIKLLAMPNNNLMAVGDDDQAIYKFRGASIANIMQFKEDFPDAKQVVLRRNYRSAQVVLDRSYEFIKNNNPYRLEVKLEIDKQLIGNPDKAGLVQELVYSTEADELAGVAGMIKSIHEANSEVSWSDFAILARSNDTAERFAKELNNHQVPSLFVSMKGLYRKNIILDCLAYLKLLGAHHDAANLMRIFNIPLFQISQSDLIKLNRHARAKLLPLFQVLHLINEVEELDVVTVERSNQLLAVLAKHYELVMRLTPSKVFIEVVRDVFLKYLDQDHNHEEINLLNQFYHKILAAEKVEPHLSLKDFLELVEMELDAGDTGNMKFNWEDNDVVKVMTIHSAKGLEFDQVFVVNMVDKRFPSIGMSDKIPLIDELVKEKLPEGDYHIQEERRLFYVAMTRAKSGLYLTRALDYGGATKKKPSIFITEAQVNNQFNMESANLTQLERDLAILGQPTQVQHFALPSKFSFSQLEAYNNCPWQYRYMYLLKVPVDDKQTAVFGRLMHNILKIFFAPCLPSNDDLATTADDVKDLSEGRLLKIFDENWSDYGYDSVEDLEKFKTKGQRMLRQVAQVTAEESAPDVLYLECPFAIKMNDFIIKGVIDRIDRLPDGSVELIDYKTGSPKDKLDFEAKKQLLLYHIAVSAIMGLKVSRLSFYYLDNGAKISFTAKDEELEKLKLWIKQTIESVKKLNFTAKPSLLCKFCDFKNICEFRD